MRPCLLRRYFFVLHPAPAPVRARDMPGRRSSACPFPLRCRFPLMVAKRRPMSPCPSTPVLALLDPVVTAQDAVEPDLHTKSGGCLDVERHHMRSEEHTSELQSLMRISYAVFCLKKKKKEIKNTNTKISQNTTIAYAHRKIKE